MGLKKGASAIYLGIFEGKLARRHKLPNNDTVTRINQENNTVHEEYFKSIEGLLVGLDKKSHDSYGDTLLIYLKDADQLYCLQLSMNSQYATIFLKTLPNVNIEKPIEVTPHSKTTDGKQDATLFIRQDGSALKRYYTKENPRGMPGPIQRKKGKKMVWEFDDQIVFLEDNVYEPFKEALKNKVVLPPSNEAKDVIPPQTGDDLPF